MALFVPFTGCGSGDESKIAEGATQMSTNKFAWIFGRYKYDNFDDFVVAFTDYNREIMGMEGPIEDFPLTQHRSVILMFMGVPEGEDGYDDLEVTITSRAGGALTFLEFMYLANKALYKFLENADHVFFEGVDPAGDKEGIPKFELVQGS